MKAKVFSAYTYMKTKLFTASIFFTLAVVLIGGITYIQLPCPVCDGKGIVTGVGDLRVNDVDYELIEHEVVGLECGYDFERYVYDFKLSVENPTTSPILGLVELTFHDPESTKTRLTEEEDEEIEVIDLGVIIAVKTIFVPEIAAGDEQTIEETIVFDALTLEIFDVKIHEVVIHTVDEFICPFHEESNKVSLTEWFRLR